MDVGGRTKLAEALFEVTYADDDHDNVHKCNVCDDREDVKNDLLRQLQVFHVNGV